MVTNPAFCRVPKVFIIFLSYGKLLVRMFLLNSSRILSFFDHAKKLRTVSSPKKDLKGLLNLP